MDIGPNYSFFFLRWVHCTIYEKKNILIELQILPKQFIYSAKALPSCLQALIWSCSDNLRPMVIRNMKCRQRRTTKESLLSFRLGILLHFEANSRRFRHQNWILRFNHWGPSLVTIATYAWIVLFFILYFCWKNLLLQYQYVCHVEYHVERLSECQ